MALGALKLQTTIDDFVAVFAPASKADKNLSLILTIVTFGLNLMIGPGFTNSKFNFPAVACALA